MWLSHLAIFFLFFFFFRSKLKIDKCGIFYGLPKFIFDFIHFIQVKFVKGPYLAGTTCCTYLLTVIYNNALLLGLGFWYLRVFGYTVIYIDIDIPEGSFI